MRRVDHRRSPPRSPAVNARERNERGTSQKSDQDVDRRNPDEAGPASRRLRIACSLPDRMLGLLGTIFPSLTAHQSQKNLTHSRHLGVVDAFSETVTFGFAQGGLGACLLVCATWLHSRCGLFFRQALCKNSISVLQCGTYPHVKPKANSYRLIAKRNREFSNANCQNSANM